MYYLLLAVLYPLSLLPLRVLYLLSDMIFVLAYHITGYRKAVVLDNLHHAFPGKTDTEIKHTCKQFYRSFCDQWIETLKLLSISEKELNRHMQGNWEVFRELDAAGKDAYALLGHTFNWEWANVACQYNMPQQFAGVYMPLKNQPFDRLMQKVRTRGGGWLISMMARKSGFQRLNDVRYVVGLIADQNPSDIQHAAWLPFLHREAPFFRGPEQLARRAKAAVVFAGIKRINRGYYQVQLTKITDDASQTSTGEIVQKYVSFMEEQIHEQPENWLWSHRRWKYSRD
jgi:KDO2-lipid IV(A) lauroyltransferase